MAKLFTPKSKCKTCKIEIEPGSTRCEPHEAAFQEYLRGGPLGAPAAAEAGVYAPRFNGVGAVSEWRTARRGCRNPRPGEELNFDDAE